MEERQRKRSAVIIMLYIIAKWTGLLTVASVCMFLSPDYVPARMGLQESSEQISGQCSPEGKGRENACVNFYLIITRDSLL